MTSILSMAEANHAQVQVAYYEVYMERCYDLLEDKSTEVSVLENNEGKIQLRGLSQAMFPATNKNMISSHFTVKF